MTLLPGPGRCADLTPPRTAVLELTFRCNHACTFCSCPWDSPRDDYPRGPELDLAQRRDCIDALIAAGVRDFALSGGEPLLCEHLPALLDFLASRRVREPTFATDGRHDGWRERAPQLNLITNGENVDAAWIERLAALRPNVVVSLPGLATFAEHTGGGSVERALAAIEGFSNAGLDVVVGICVTKRNLPELLPTIAAGFLAGAKQLLLNRFLPGGRGLLHPELMLDRSEIVTMLTTAEEACVAANSYGSIGTELPLCVIQGEFKMLKVGTMCAGGVDFFAIDPAGRLRPCNHSPLTCGDWRDVPAALAHPHWQRFRTKNFLPGPCRRCHLSLQCDGGCREAAHLVGGHLDALDPLFITEGGLTPPAPR